jgi:hypothetical protein
MIVKNHVSSCVISAELLAHIATVVREVSGCSEDKAIEASNHFARSLNERERIAQDASFQRFLDGVATCARDDDDDRSTISR